MKSSGLKRLCLYTYCCLLCLLANSQALYASDESLSEELPVIDTLQPLDESRDAFSRQVVSFANWLDSFFGENRIYEEITGNYLKLNLQHISQQGNSPDYNLRITGKITLPRTENRLKLLIESEADKDIAENQHNTPLQALESQNQSIALQYTPKSTSKWRSSTDAGIRLRSSLDFFMRLRSRRLIEYTAWTLRASESLYWYRTLGAGVTSQLDMERPLGSQRLFRATTTVTWLDRNQYFDLGQELTLFHNLDKRRAILYQTSVNGISQPDTHTTNYGLSVRLRQKIHRDWLFLELNPQINYPLERDFAAVKSLTLNLEAIFGKN